MSWERDQTQVSSKACCDGKKADVPIRIVHLVKLVDHAHSLVGEDEGTSLESPLAGDGVLADAGGQSDGGRSLSGREDSAVRRLLDVLEELGLSRSGISEE